MSASSILYLGDTSLSGAAGYLAGLMSLWKFAFDYAPTDERADESLVGASERKLFILSDFPAANMPDSVQAAIVEHVDRGAGLLMIGGWESFRGVGGKWAGTRIGNALPVEIETSDDRINCAQPALLAKVIEHPTVGALPWVEEPPTVGGFNRFKPKLDSTTVLDVQRFSAQWHKESMQFLPTERHPMLVVGSCGKGRTAALATDLAPHWVGGFVDWGSVRVTAQAPGSWQIEVGAWYAAFIRNLLTWTGNL